jgi:hypothetical protein
MAFNLSMFIGKEGTHFGLLAGLATGFGWVSLAFGVNYLFEGRSFKHWIINAGYNTVVFGVMGLIIGAMQAAPQIVTTETLAENETLSKPDIAIPSEINSYTKSEIWIVTDASEYEIRYRPIEWYTDEQAQLEAEKDGERTPGGFYWRYKDDETTPRIWPVTNPLQIRTELLCQNAICLKGTDGYANVTLSFDGYLNATIACEANQEQCFYYGIGSGMDFFDVTISKDNEILSLKSRYVP